MEVEKLYSNMEEIVTKAEAEKLSENKNISAYIGFEPSGMPHIGTALMWPKKLSELQDDIKIYVLLADWHAMINNKLGGDLGSIRKSGDLLKKSMMAEGLDKVEYIWASDVVSDPSYWETFIKTAKNTTLPRLNRALPIMGRTENDAAKDFGMYIYPIMQVTDIFHLKVDIAFGGMDQRHAHMLARDISDRLKIKKVISVHGPLLSSLKG
ncbi:MAG: tyrosine--tRNA ligase, partial [Thermoplasmata archaeon]